MKKITLITILLAAIGSAFTAADEVDVKEVLAESLVEGTREGLCGDRVTVQWMMRSADEKLRRQGNACFSVGQAEKIKGRLSGDTKKNGEVVSSSARNNSQGLENKQPQNQKSRAAESAKQKTECRNEGGVVKCKIWFPETHINGEVIPAGFRDVEMGKN